LAGVRISQKQADLRKDVINFVSLEINEDERLHHISKSVVKETTAEELFH
jgi:hypothetical protein